MSGKWDFSGWATKAGIRCSDGRTIRKGAFKDCDGKTVPLVWNHNHNDVSEVLGHALLEDRDGDIFTYCSFNNTQKGREAKELVQHGDIVSLSIYANNLKQSSKNPPCEVYHGIIREVSLVLAGANPGAFIENVGFAHGEASDEEEAIIYHDDDNFEFFHAEKEEDETEKKKPEEEKEETPEAAEAPEETKEEAKEEAKEEESDEEGSEEERKKLREAALAVMKKKALSHADESDESDDSDETIDDVIKTMSDKQKEVMYALVGMALQGENKDTNEEEDSNMRHNVFDTENMEEQGVLLHSEDKKAIFEAARRTGSLKSAVEDYIEEHSLAHATDSHGNTITYGIADIDYLFPDAKTLQNTPDFITRNMDWVKEVINGTHHTPFSRVKSMFADITADEARAKGYTKGQKKVEEVITLLKRDTPPQTIYKLQKLDRDDILDITDFDVVAWIKGEMRIMLEEEIARAILIGDGRNGLSNDKIKETNVRPVFNDADLYTVKFPVTVAANATAAQKAQALMDAVLMARPQYKGSGNPTFFTTDGELTNMLLLKDDIGHRFYKTEAEVATALRAKKVTTVEPMEGQKIGITVSGTTTQYDLAGVLVNLTDYNVGADKGGQTSLFDDFDIDYNQYKYLLETRISGALIKPYSAISFYYVTE